MKPTQLSISVIIPVHNGGESFRQCLSSIGASISQPTEVIVVADGDTESGQVAADWGAKVINVKEKGGPAQARNLGAAAAQGEIIFFVDADVAIAPDTINQVRLAFAEDANLGAVIGSYDDAPGASNFLSQYKNLFHHYTHQNANEDAFTFWGACGAIRRDIFLAMGGFDKSYRRPCVEDIELGYRLKAAGYKIRLDKALQVKHLKRWGIVSLVKADVCDRALPWTQLILRQGQMPSDLNLGWSSRLSVILVYSLSLSLVACWWQWKLLIMTAVICALLVGINASVYRFFLNKRGIVFTLGVLPWHWFYYFYSGLAFVIGILSKGII
ncbi:glycosyltransferase [Nodularia sphaerocarpa]|uniref:glycosyltransferase n=1 Tax=Nodularia sphaerocarpa TaxID=137816 RepID=UPI001EFAED0F|nr:glycosyltransferase family 2 protein [Nodularia sphaerocarpa]MDB9372529.1 glycosyltransferase family 2 protein [Nodularia sphaerocarpa CS-585]MDB9376921.1 glycosyltransferase family 2 protein [Nodularia sphaerocarpa CS-585A2]ULP73661.1 Putative glycosyltransferase EpsH [Nodularia sphaerocarpa UHCC 0038]